MKKSFIMIVSLVGLMTPVLADEAEAESRAVFGKWRIGVGAAFNGAVSSSLGVRNLPVPRQYSVPAGMTKEDAWGKAAGFGGGFIARDSLDNGFDTENWMFPVSAYQGDGVFLFENAYQEVVGSSVNGVHRDTSDDQNQFGISLEVSRELLIFDEDEEHRWGIDFAAAFSYFFQRDIFGACGTVSRTDTVRDGSIQRTVVDPDAMYDYDHGWDSPIGGMYGYGNSTRTFLNPAFGWSGVHDPVDVGGPTHGVVSSYGYNASGDYQELEMLFMFRPWYEITDWWRVFAEVGAGVSWGRFDSDFSCQYVNSSESFNQWDVYGVAGLGTIVRYKQFDISLDFLGRFLRDDMDIDGRYVDGSIDRANWGFRVMVGYEF